MPLRPGDRAASGRIGRSLTHLQGCCSRVPLNLSPPPGQLYLRTTTAPRLPAQAMRRALMWLVLVCLALGASAPAEDDVCSVCMGDEEDGTAVRAVMKCEQCGKFFCRGKPLFLETALEIRMIRYSQLTPRPSASSWSSPRAARTSKVCPSVSRAVVCASLSGSHLGRHRLQWRCPFPA